MQGATVLDTPRIVPAIQLTAQALQTIVPGTRGTVAPLYLQRERGRHILQVVLPRMVPLDPLLIRAYRTKAIDRSILRTAQIQLRQPSQRQPTPCQGRTRLGRVPNRIPPNSAGINGRKIPVVHLVNPLGRMRFQLHLALGRRAHAGNRVWQPMVAGKLQRIGSRKRHESLRSEQGTESCNGSVGAVEEWAWRI